MIVMNQMMTQELIKLVSFKTEYIQIYKKCFDDPLWRQLYGVAVDDFKFEDFIENSVLKEYPTVERLIVLNKTNEPVLFAHLCSENKSCVVVGGIVPKLVNSGQGIYCSLFIFDYIFKSKEVSSITVSISKSNSISYKMVQSFGFREKENQNDETKSTLQLNRADFPNAFAKYLLSKSKYEKR